MTENMGKWPSKRGPIAKIMPSGGYRIAAEEMEFPWRWNGGTISLNLDVIWGMSAKIMPSDGCKGDTVPLAVARWYSFGGGTLVQFSRICMSPGECRLNAIEREVQVSIAVSATFVGKREW